MSFKSDFPIGKVRPRRKRVLAPFISNGDMNHLHRELVVHSQKKLEIKINDNRSTMLSVKWEADRTRVSLHRIFLDAPQNVMEELACYIGRKHRHLTPTIRAFIHERFRKLDYSDQVDTNQLDTCGVFYDLQELYDNVNQTYFQGKLNLSITWFGSTKRKNRTRITFGLYQDQLKLIKINRLLDNKKIPKFFISFIIYHEMLHCVSPSYYDKKGVHRIHSKEFKALEKLHGDYDKAQEWIRVNKTQLFQPDWLPISRSGVK